MTPKSAAHTVFATPELALAISAYLTQHDLTQCARVCKDWMQLNEPILYRAFCPFEPLGGSTPSPQTAGGLIRNLPHIRTVELYPTEHDAVHSHTVMQELAHGLPQCTQAGDSALDPDTLCTNLQHFKFRCGSNDDMLPALPHLITLLNHNHFLTRLMIPLTYSSLDTGSFAAVSRLRHLRSLAVFTDINISCEGRRPISLFLQACLPLPELSELDMDLYVGGEDEVNDQGIPDFDTIIEEATIARFSGNSSACKIKSLLFPRCSDSGSLPLARSLLVSDLVDLESLTVPELHSNSDALHLEQVIRERCTHLKHLTCSVFYELGSAQFVRAVIRGCSGLKSFTSLFGFADEDNNYEPRLLILDLVERHCNTLEEITLECCHQVYSADLQAVLTRCKQLKRLWVQSAFLIGRAGIEFTDLSMSDWVCTELRVLGLTLNRYPNGEDSDLDEEDPGLMALDGERFYRQIGQLGKLEELALDIDRSEETMTKESDYAWDLTLSRGWLGELAKLKSLKRLRLNADFWSKMGQADVEFMHEQWPLLNEISLQGQVSDERTQAHWQWLFDQRPRLLFTTTLRSSSPYEI
ncbi:hypothetical protein BGZ70_006564 [Mortierella alpina]|uniref:F-box domain-containing protein n=1 Tax=Mortierella alpina TaxID=64518 RepID=A0A9P6M2Z0_MORAP|nr:hypothetical protein BGZ70_006564 [Mortierella alpina]